MKNYTIKPDGENFKIVETSSEEMVIAVGNREKIRELAKKLNGGSGFRGCTPPFVVRKPLDCTEAKET